uniref:Odorant receptor 69a n=1 Tax=Drosophila rhopaloa TaxID=1041015 RepID=A0A6P4G3W1_DRORH
MQLHDYMKYLDLAFCMAMIPPFQWNGRPTERNKNEKARKTLFVIGLILLAYLNVGFLIYWILNGRKASNTQDYVAGISEMAGSLMLSTVATCNALVITINRPQFEEVLANLEEIHPKSRDKHYRCQHYCRLATGIMKCEGIYYTIFVIYFNMAPLVGMLFEYLMDKENFSYRLQLNIWFPWNIQDSVLVYSLTYLSLCYTSCISVAFTMITQNIICIFTFQFKLHIDGLADQLITLDSRHAEAHRKLRKLIEYHYQILKLGEKMNKTLNISFLVSLVFTTIAICMTSVAVLHLDLGSAFQFVNGLIAFISYNFIICYLGSEVTDEMQLEDFIRYPVLVCRVPQLPRIEWNGRRLRVNRNLVKRFIFWFGAINLLYHNIGGIMYGYFVDSSAIDPIDYVAEMTENKQLSYRIQSNSWYPWKIEASLPGFFAAIVCQAGSAQANMCVIIFTQYLITFFVVQLQIQFDGLAKRIEAIDARDPTAKDQLKSLIKCHNRLLNLADSVNQSFNFTFLLILLASISSLCFLGFSIIVMDLGTALKQTMGLLIFLLYNFSLSQDGTDLIFVSEKVLSAAFYNNWYEGDLAYRKMLLILMIRASKPYVWRTYKLAPVSIDTYVNTLKLSYQMFTCVRSLK